MTKINIYASKDTFVCSDPTSKALNFGKQLNLIISSSNKALLYFDISSIPANARITSANLQLFLYRFQPLIPSSITINQLKTDFYENVVSSDTAPGSAPLLPPDIALRDIVPKNINTVITFDNLTNTVKSWYDSSSDNHGFELSTSTASTLSFFSREYSEQDLQPKLEVEYTIDNDLPFIETAIMTQMIYPSDNSVVETNIYDISKALLFSYFIDNSIFNDLTRETPDVVNISLKTCDTRNGIFKNIGSEIYIPAGRTHSLEVSPINKYVRLSVSGTPNTCLKVSGVYKIFNTMLPSSVKSAKIAGDTIILTMTKPLTGTTVDKNAFTITLLTKEFPLPTVTVIETLVSGTTVTLTCSDNAFFMNGLVLPSLTYLPTGTNNLTGINGDVFSFTNQQLPIATEYITIDQLNILQSIEPIQTTTTLDLSTYISKAQTFKYLILNDPKNSIVATVSLQGSDSITGPFTNIVSDTVIDKVHSKDNFIIPVSLKTKYKFVRLSIKEFTATDPTSKLNIITLYSVYPDDIPSSVESAKVLDTGNKILITMTKDLTGELGDNTAFTTSSSLPDLKITNILISKRSLELTLSRAITPTDLTFDSENHFSLNLSYTKSGANNITGINGDIDNFNNQRLELSTEEISIDQPIQSLPEGAQTTIYDTSKALSFTYFIRISENGNPIVTLQDCATRNGIFENVGEPLVFENVSYYLTVSKTKKYVCLLVKDDGIQRASLSASISCTALSNNMPSRVHSGEVVTDGSKIVLTMTKTLEAITQGTNANAFIINSKYTELPSPSKATTLTVSDKTVTIEVSPPVKQSDSITLTYKGTGTNDLTGETGYVDNFTNKPINNTSTVA